MKERKAELALKNLENEIFVRKRNIKYNEFMLEILDEDMQVRKIDLELTISRDKDLLSQLEEQEKALKNKGE